MRPGVEVEDPREDAAPGEDEVDAPAPELRRQLVDVPLDEDGVRNPFPCELEGFRRDVEAGHERAEPGQLRRRLARRTLEVEDVLAGDGRQPFAHPLRDPELAGHRLGAAAVHLVPCPTVVIRRFHRQASNE